MAAAVVVDLPECPHEMIEPSKLAPSTPEAASYSAPHVDGSDSELSDIEDGEEEKKDIGQIVPDRYEGGVPIFTPTMDQFKDFMQYMDKINEYGMQTGIVKVIPPAEWVEALPPLEEAIKTIRIKDPIAQEITGTGGTYRQLNLTHQRTYNLPQWRQLCDQSEHQPPAKRGERRANRDNGRTATRTRAPPNRAKTTTTAATGTKKKGRGRPGRKSAGAEKVDDEEQASTASDRLPTPVSPPVKNDDDLDSVKMEDEEVISKPSPKPMGRMGGGRMGGGRMGGGRMGGAVASTSSRRKYNRREATWKVDEEAFKDFEYRMRDEEYTAEQCEELERAYWKTLTYASPLYGADMPGSLFDESVPYWNLGKLDNLLDILGTKIPGVNTAYLYLGMWKATFAWHLEDVDLYSINFNHFGAPKQWYSISQKDARRFEAAMKSIWPIDAKACDQFLRHKTFLISPTTLLEKYNIKVNKVVHHPNEFVITFPYGYHSGFNLGYNAAEAVNFAMESWLELGRVAKRCDCDQAQDSVWIDEHDMRKLRGEESVYDESDEEDEMDIDGAPTDLPTPPGDSGDVQAKRPRVKRKRPAADKDGQSSTKRIRLRIPVKQPCVLCPNEYPSDDLLPADEGHKAHRLCASYIPETYIEQSGKKELVVGVSSIAKARLELKCGFCKSKKGAAFQCSQKKCTRAFHATCAAAAGVFVEEGERPVFGPDGTEYKEYSYEFSCRFHRTKRDKNLDGDALEDDKTIRKAALELTAGDVCQFQYYRHDIFAGIVKENHVLEEMLLINVLPKGDTMEVAYKWLLLPDPLDYRMPKPSANAIPLPRKSQKAPLITSKRQANDLPRKDDIFVEGYTWEEFHSLKLAKNSAQVKVDLTKPDQVWYYIGKGSTDAKARYSDDPANPQHNPKGSFLDTIPKPAPVSTSRQSYAASYPATASYTTAGPYPAAGGYQYNVNAVSAIPRPLQQSSQMMKSEKPYEYKPRSGSESYQVDPRAWQTQQKFVQKSAAPYTYGSDPAFQTNRPLTGAYKQGSPTYSPYQPNTAYPQMSNQNRWISPSAPAAPVAPAGPPASAGYQPPIRPVNPAGQYGSSSHKSLGSRYAAKPNPFAKYPYLQKQHNRSPLDYKSPYKPPSQGGGFMNGYEGNLKEHLKRNPDALFRMQMGSSSSSTSSQSPITPQSGAVGLGPYGIIAKPPQPSYAMTNQSSPATPYTSTASAPRQGMSTYSSTQYPYPQTAYSGANPTPAGISNTYAGGGSPPLHPAIRQNYGNMAPQSQRPPQAQQSPQNYYTSSVYGREIAEATAMHRPNVAPPAAAMPQAAQPQQSKPLYPHQQYFAQGPHMAPPAGQPQAPMYQQQPPIQASPAPTQLPRASRQPPQTPVQLPPPQSYPPILPGQLPRSQMQQPQALPPVPKATIQQPTAPLQGPPAQVQPLAAPVSLPPVQSQPAPPREVPDVPADSTGLMEQLMANLRKASSHSEGESLPSGSS